MEALRRELTCPVCLELFRQPLALPCQHSLCKPCVDGLLQKSPTASDGEDAVRCFPCPSCRQLAQVSPDCPLQPNRLLANIVARYSSITPPPAPLCDMCEEEPGDAATRACVECGVRYCDACFAVCHRMKGPLASHTITVPSATSPDGAAGSRESMCSTHSKEKINMFCLSCDKLICALCKLVGSHNDHQVTDIGAAYKMRRDALTASSKALTDLTASLAAQLSKLESHATDIQVACERSKVELVAELDQLQCIINARKRSLTRDLERHYNTQLAANQRREADCRERLAQFQALTTFAEEALKETAAADHNSFLEFSSLLSERMRAAQQQVPEELTQEALRVDRLINDFSLEKEMLQELDFLKVPGAPEFDVDSCHAVNDSIIVRWNQPARCAVSGYRVSYRVSGASDCVTCPAAAAPAVPSNQTRIDGLQFETTYEVTVVAENMAGVGPASAPLTLTTPPKPPDTPVIDLEECVVERNSVTVVWAAAAAAGDEHGKGDVTFTLQFRDARHSEWNVKKGLEETQCTLPELAYNTRYVIRVKAVNNAAGCSQFSSEVSLHTWPLPPEPPELLPEHSTGHGNRYQLQWTPPDGCTVSSYTVEYRAAHRGEDWTVVEGVTTTHWQVTGLAYDTGYVARVRAVNVSGESDYSDSLHFTTGSPPIRFSLDPNTAHVNLRLTDSSATYDRGGAKARVCGEDAFIGASFSVLGDKSVFKGKHYWEVKTRPKSSDRIGVAYKTTARDCSVGDSETSWAVGFVSTEEGKLFCFHNKKKKKLAFQLPPAIISGTSPAKTVTIGVLLDCEDGGFLAFFLCDPSSSKPQHLHSFKTRFDQPVYPAFTVWPSDLSVVSGLPVPEFLLL